MPHKYAHVRNEDDTIIKTVQYDNFDAVKVAHKFGPDKTARIVPVENLPDPEIVDASIEQYGPTTTVVEATRVTKQRTVEPIPQGVIDDRDELAAVKAVALDLKNGVGTAAERLTRVEKVLSRMLRDQYGD
jgi:hypothetical protein